PTSVGAPFLPTRRSSDLGTSFLVHTAAGTILPSWSAANRRTQSLTDGRQSRRSTSSSPLNPASHSRSYSCSAIRKIQETKSLILDRKSTRLNSSHGSI